MTNLYILEDNLYFSKNLCNLLLQSNPNIKLNGIFTNGNEFIKSVKDFESSDILLLDLGIPKLNGVQVLNYLLQTCYTLPHIIIISGNAALILDSKQYDNYIDAIFYKPFSFQALAKKITSIMSSAKPIKREEIVQYLSVFDFNKSNLGFKFLVDCIMLAYENEALLFNMENNLYSHVSSMNRNISTKKIKWNINKCLNSMYCNTSEKIISNYFYIDAKPTPKIFISTVINKLK